MKFSAFKSFGNPFSVALMTVLLAYEVCVRVAVRSVYLGLYSPLLVTR